MHCTHEFNAGQAGSTAPVATAADPKPADDSGEAELIEGDSPENDLISAIKLEPFPEQYRAAIAAAAMAVPMDAYTPPPRPPLPQPPATPPPDPLPLNGCVEPALESIYDCDSFC